VPGFDAQRVDGIEAAFEQAGIGSRCEQGLPQRGRSGVGNHELVTGFPAVADARQLALAAGKIMRRETIVIKGCEMLSVKTAFEYRAAGGALQCDHCVLPREVAQRDVKIFGAARDRL